MRQDAPGALVIRVTLNRRLYVAVFGGHLKRVAWLGLATFLAGALVLSRPDSLAMLAVAGLLFASCSWPVLRAIPTNKKLYPLVAMGVPTLELDDRGVHVRDVPMHFDGVGLAWTDCAAVVVSAPPEGAVWPIQPLRYVQFVPVNEELVQSSAGPERHWDLRAKNLGVSEAAASLAWLELPGSDPDADDVVAWLRAHQPHLRIVGAGHSVTDE